MEEWRGIRNVVVAEVIKDDADTFETGTPFSLAGVAKLIRKTPSSSESHYYDNAPMIVIDSTGADEVTVSTSAIPYKPLSEVTGQDYDEELGMFVEGERESKYFAMGYVTEKTDGTEVFVWRAKGKFNIPDSTHSTKDDGTTAEGQEIVYTGVNTNHKFTVNGKKKTIKAINIDTSINTVDETAFFETVQTPDTVANVAA